MIDIETAQADGATIAIRWDGGAARRGSTRPTVVGRGESLLAWSWHQRLRQPAQVVRGPRPAASAVGHPDRGRQSFTGKVAGELGHRTVFARLEQGALSWWQPLLVRGPTGRRRVVRPQPWIGNAARCNSPVQNNTGQPVAADVTMRCGLCQCTGRGWKSHPTRRPAVLRLPPKAWCPAPIRSSFSRTGGDAARRRGRRLAHM